MSTVQYFLYSISKQALHLNMFNENLQMYVNFTVSIRGPHKTEVLKVCNKKIYRLKIIIKSQIGGIMLVGSRDLAKEG